MMRLVSVIFMGMIICAIAGCDTTRNIYKSSSSKKDYFTIDAVTLSHCGCTHIYAENFKNGKKEFQIFYNDNLARKTLFTYNSVSKTPGITSILATASDNFEIPFDSLDSRMFSLIDSLIVNISGIVYPIKRTLYKGYITDTLMQR